MQTQEKKSKLTVLPSCWGVTLYKYDDHDVWIGLILVSRVVWINAGMDEKQFSVFKWTI